MFATNAVADGICFDIRAKLHQLDRSEKLQVLLNGKLIRPEIDTDKSFLEKDRLGILGHILIREDEIFDLFEGSSCEESHFEGMGVEIIDLEGRYVIPGLHDLHVHNFGVNADLPNSPIFSKDGSKVVHFDYPGMRAMNYRMLYAGVTSHLDLMSFNEDTRDFRQEQHEYLHDRSLRSKEALPFSNIYMAGGLFTFKGSHHGSVTFMVGEEKESSIFMDTETIVHQKNPQIRRAALFELLSAHIKKYNPDVLKISYDHNPHRPGSPTLNGLSREVLRDFVRVSQDVQPGIKVVCHVGVWQDVVDCMEEGAAAVTHIPFSKPNDPAYRIPDGIFAEMKRRNLTVIPTMTVYMEEGLIRDQLFDITRYQASCQKDDHGCTCTQDVCVRRGEKWTRNNRRHFFEDHLLRELAPKDLLDHYFEHGSYEGNPWVQWQSEHTQMGYRQETFRRLMDAGVRVLSGTDTMWGGTFFGFSLHRELELMSLSNESVKVPLRPLTNMEILATSTSKVHEFLNHHRGRLKAGFKADLLILNSSPILDIRNTREIYRVMVNGDLVNSDQLRPHLKVGR